MGITKLYDRAEAAWGTKPYSEADASAHQVGAAAAPSFGAPFVRRQ